MAKFTKELVDKYANDLLIGLTDEENKMVLDEFDVIDKDIDIINSIDGIDKVEPMTHALDDQVIKDLRDDIPEESPNIDDLLSNAKHKIGREIEVLRVVKDE